MTEETKPAKVETTEEKLHKAGVQFISLEDAAWGAVDYAVENPKSVQVIFTTSRMKADYMIQEIEMRIVSKNIPMKYIWKTDRKAELQNEAKIIFAFVPAHARGWSLDRCIIADFNFDRFFDEVVMTIGPQLKRPANESLIIAS